MSMCAVCSLVLKDIYQRERERERERDMTYRKYSISGSQLATLISCPTWHDLPDEYPWLVSLSENVGGAIVPSHDTNTKRAAGLVYNNFLKKINSIKRENRKIA